MNFNGIKKEELQKYISGKYNVFLEDNIVSYLNGSIGSAIDIIEKKEIEKFQKVDILYRSIVQKDSIKALMQIADIDFLDEYILDYFEYILYINCNYSCIKFVEKANIRLKYNGNYDIVVDNMILKIIDEI